MCGICGIAGQGGCRETVERMTKVIAHRGPDGFGIHEGNGIFLGHRRLSIIDLKTGEQPMTNEDKSLWVVFNGEIYNFKELRRDLEERGHCFSTNSDTEVLIHGYEEYGLSFLPKLNGIFAYALWDDRRKRLLLVRDYFGIKPLYYHFDGKTLHFASEIKAIIQDANISRELDRQSLHFFLNLRYIPGEGTLFKGIKRLPSAHYLLYENGQITIQRYFDLQPMNENLKSEADYCEGIRHYLQESVRRQKISDVPIGVYLSGGLDSSALVAFMSKVTDEPIRTFSMGFNEPTDELDDARVIAEHFRTEHHEIRLSPDPLCHFPEVIWHAEEPKENILQGFLLSRFAAQHVKVCLGGLGGDELFAGYELHKYIYPLRHLHRFVPPSISSGILSPLRRALFSIQNKTGCLSLDEYRRGMQMLLSLGDPMQYYLILRNAWDDDNGAYRNVYGSGFLTQDLLKTGTQFNTYFQKKNKDVLEQVLWAEFNTKMQEDFLMNEDRTSMANGLEVRVPFLDRDLVRFAMSIPVEMKMKNGELKYLFRQAMESVLPPHALAKKKGGFSFNPYYQFQKDLKIVAEKVLTRQCVEDRGVFNYAYLKKIMEYPPHPRLRWHYFFLWLALGMEIWFQMFLDGDVTNPVFDLEFYIK
ncbi:MAG TPA: asparagine synthase (glutamine-hydrolyzing) [Candidatus Methanoperedens sp.]